MDYKERLELAKDWYNDPSTTKKEKALLEKLFPKLVESKNEKIRKHLLKLAYRSPKDSIDFMGEVKKEDVIAWLEKQGEQKPDWNEYDMVVIDAIYNTLKHSNVTKCGVEVTEMLEWLEELEKQGKRNSADPFLNWLEKQGEQNNLVEQLTAFAQHLNKRGAFREDLCMDLEHEAQSFIEFREYQNNKEL